MCLNGASDLKKTHHLWEEWIHAESLCCPPATIISSFLFSQNDGFWLRFTAARRLYPAAASRAHSLVAVRRVLTAGACLIERGLYSVGFSSFGTQL